MPLDIMPTARTVTSTLHYLQRGKDKPARYVSEPPPGVPRWNGIDDPHDVSIEDARGHEADFTLDRNGFALIKAPTAVSDFYSEDEIKQVYYPEVARLLEKTLGASRVFVFDHNVRNAGRSGMAEPSRRVHNDHTVNSAPRRVRDHLGAEAGELLKHRFGVVNAWRGRSAAPCWIHRSRCAMRAASPTTISSRAISFTIMSAARHPRSPTDPITAGIISPRCSRTNDSATDGRARLSFHTSFDNPLAQGAQPRESIEVRSLVFFPPGA
jgi:hypothetical protein